MQPKAVVAEQLLTPSTKRVSPSMSKRDNARACCPDHMNKCTGDSGHVSRTAKKHGWSEIAAAKHHAAEPTAASQENARK